MQLLFPSFIESQSDSPWSCKSSGCIGVTYMLDTHAHHKQPLFLCRQHAPNLLKLTALA